MIELSGAYPALQQAIRIAGPGGTVVAAGFYQGPRGALFLGEEFHLNQVTLAQLADRRAAAAPAGRWSRERLHETVMDLCAQGRLDPLPLVTHVLDAHEAAKAYELAGRAAGHCCRSFLDFGRSP